MLKLTYTLLLHASLLPFATARSAIPEIAFIKIAQSTAFLDRGLIVH